MSKYFWLLVLTIPMWAAAELSAPKWALMLTSVPFFLRAATLGDHPDEHLLGEGFAHYRPSILIVFFQPGVALTMAIRDA